MSFLWVLAVKRRRQIQAGFLCQRYRRSSAIARPGTLIPKS